MGDVSVYDEPRTKEDCGKQQDALSKKTGTWLGCGMAARGRLQAATSVTHIEDREVDFMK